MLALASVSLMGTAGAATAAPARVSSSASAAQQATAYPPINVVLRNRATGRCLDDSVLGRQTIDCNGLAFQLWRTDYMHANPIELLNVATGLCLDDSAAHKLRTAGCNGKWGGYQAWQVRIWPGGAELLNKATGLCLDDSIWNGLRTFPCNAGYGGHQLWDVIQP